MRPMPNIPHRRGGEPDELIEKELDAKIFPTGVGVNRSRVLNPAFVLKYSPQAWG